jgi:predicted enzyme related to lactoylglutathione lyase
MKKSSSPRIFRLLLPARDLSEARRFYETLLGTRGRVVAPGRIYFDCGSVILGILDHSSMIEADRSKPTEALYLACEDLESVHRRAKELGCLSPGLIHENPLSPMGEIVIRPWGERSFYATDPSGNPLCFVDGKTRFTGTPRQVTALQLASSDRSGVSAPQPTIQGRARRRA